MLSASSAAKVNQYTSNVPISDLLHRLFDLHSHSVDVIRTLNARDIHTLQCYYDHVHVWRR